MVQVVVGKNALKTLQLPQRFFSLTAAAGSLVEPPKAEAQFKKYWVCLDHKIGVKRVTSDTVVFFICL